MDEEDDSEHQVVDIERPWCGLTYYLTRPLTEHKVFAMKMFKLDILKIDTINEIVLTNEIEMILFLFFFPHYNFRLSRSHTPLL